MLVSPSMLRLTWAVVEELPTGDLLTLSDTMLIKLLLQHVARRIALNGEEIYALYSYLGAKLSLIRDMATFRDPEAERVLPLQPVTLAQPRREAS
jgi:hypothetical protein